MKRFLSLIALAVCLNNCLAQTVNFPTVKKQPVTDEFYNKYKVTDDYRWMENLGDSSLHKWVNAENAITRQYLLKLSSKYNVINRINELSDVKYNNFVKKGKYYFVYAYHNDYEAPALFYQSKLKQEYPEMLIDPSFISHKDRISIRGYEISEDNKYLAYEYSRNGSDWEEIGVKDILGPNLDDHLTNVKFSSIAWHGNGFYYSEYPNTGAIAKTEGQIVRYHKLGTDQKDDELIFKRNDPSMMFEFLVTKDSRYFILEEHNRKANLSNYFYIDYQDPEHALKPLLTNLKFSINIIDSHNGKLIATSSHEAENGNIIEIDPQNPTNWRVIAPSYSQSLLLEVMPLKDKIIAVYQAKLHPSIVAIDYDGKVLHSISFPLGTSIRGLNGSPDDDELFYTYESYTTPPVPYTINTVDFKRSLVHPSTVPYDYEDFIYKESEYTVNDSVKVPIMLIYKKGTLLDGNNPTLLESYGGFGLVSEPQFDPGIVYFLTKGGVYAYAYIRGGGELGANWAKYGKGKYKQNSFSDFIAGAEYLIKAGYTKPSKLAITGGSNGGLVVAAAAMQRPDLFKAVVPVVAPFDMLRFENFTIGNFHANEYGTVKDSTSFTRLYNYSPYNNIKENVNYPAMLVVTSDHDDRVPPLHSYKFVAKMQSRPTQTNPVYLLNYKQAGHNGISSANFRAALLEQANTYSFLMEMLK